MWKRVLTTGPLFVCGLTDGGAPGLEQEHGGWAVCRRGISDWFRGRRGVGPAHWSRIEAGENVRTTTLVHRAEVKSCTVRTRGPESKVGWDPAKNKIF